MSIRQVVQRGLRIDHQPSLVRAAGAEPIAAVFQHKHAAPHQLGQHVRDGNAMPDVASVAMEHQHGRRDGLCRVRRPDEEGGQLLAVRRRDLKLLVIVDAIVAGLGDLCAGVAGDVRGVDEGSAEGGGLAVLRIEGGAREVDVLLFEVQGGAQDDGKALCAVLVAVSRVL
jgi:hypothetical protein